MRTRKFLAITAMGLLVAVTVSAQVAQFSASGSYLKGTGDNDVSLWGGGIAGKGFLGQHVAIGVKVNAYPKKTSSGTVGSFNYTSANLVTNAAATLDFFLSSKKSMLQPYLGIDAGASFNNQTVTFTNSNTQVIENKNKQTFFLLSPKAGVNIGLGQAFGIFAQAQYNLTFGDGKTVSFNELPNFQSKPVDKYFTIDAGIYFRLMPAGK
ncbi:hypothetical protein BH10BAC3_BH10BAC3_16390 [soil metagenome]